MSLLSKPTLSQVTHIAFTLNRIHDKDWAMNGIGLLKTRLSFKHDPINQNPCWWCVLLGGFKKSLVVNSCSIWQLKLVNKLKCVCSTSAKKKFFMGILILLNYVPYFEVLILSCLFIDIFSKVDLVAMLQKRKFKMKYFLLCKCLIFE